MNQGSGGDMFSFVVPTEFVELPSEGRFYPESHPLHNQDVIEIKQMTAKEEDILTSQTLLKQGVALDRLLQSLIVDKRINPASLLSGDRSAIIVAARRSGYGSVYESQMNCPSCGTKQEFSFNLNESTVHQCALPEGVKDEGGGIFSLVLPRTKINVKLRLLTGQEEMEMLNDSNKRKKRKKAENNITSQLKKIVYSVNGVSDSRAINYFSENVPSSETKYIRDVYKAISPTTEMKDLFECQNCGFSKELEVPLNAEFFWPN
jgi:rubredoxin